MKSPDTKARMAYNLIESKADSSMFVEGLSGLFGFPFTVIADASVIFTHYYPMICEIRKIYKRKEVDKDTLVPMFSSLKGDLIVDLLLDQGLGQIPVVGIYFNLICAKAMTWRIGLLFAIASSRGDEVDNESLKDAMNLIRQLSPQSGIFRFNQPKFLDFLSVESAVRDKKISTYRDILSTILIEISKGHDVKHIKFKDL